MIQCYLLFCDRNLVSFQAVLSSNLSLPDVSPIHEVNQGLNIFGILDIDESIAPDKTFWIPGYDYFINSYKLFAQQFQLVKMSIIWNIHQVDALVEQCWVKPIRLFVLINKWSSITNQIIDSSIVEVLDRCGGLLLRIEFNNSFASVLAQVVLYQFDLVNLTNC